MASVLHTFHCAPAAEPASAATTIKAVDDEYSLTWRPGQEYRAALRVLDNDVGSNLSIIEVFTKIAPVHAQIELSKNSRVIVYR